MNLTQRQKITIAALVIYWIVLLIVAHIPIPEVVYQAQVSDKWLHFLAYLNLVFLMWFAVRPDGRVRWRGGLVWLVFFAAITYGGLDELLQPYVGRTKDMGDFLANAVGVSAGLVMFTFLAFWQALLATLAITIFGITNLAKANLSEVVPVTDAVFHIVAYGGFTLVWVRFMNLYPPTRALVPRLLSAVSVPIALLLIVKGASLLLDRRFAMTDILFANLAIFAAAAASYLTGLLHGCRRLEAKGV